MYSNSKQHAAIVYGRRKVFNTGEIIRSIACEGQQMGNLCGMTQ